MTSKTIRGALGIPTIGAGQPLRWPFALFWALLTLTIVVPAITWGYDGHSTLAAESAETAGGNLVYQSVDSAGNVNYVGITNNLERRAAEQFADKGISIQPIPGLQDLTRDDACKIKTEIVVKITGAPK